jgi:hypothetical protein
LRVRNNLAAIVDQDKIIAAAAHFEKGNSFCVG